MELTIQSLVEDTKKFMKHDEGKFILSLGKDRVLPETINQVPADNYSLVKLLYRTALETSLNQYVKRYSAALDLEVTKLFNWSERLMEFLFGNEEHVGVYPVLLQLHQQSFSESPIGEILKAGESMFVEGYKIRRLEGNHLLLKPTLEVVTQVPAYEATTSALGYDYLGAVKHLLGITNDVLSSEQKTALMSLEVASEREKTICSAPKSYKNFLVPLDYLMAEGYRFSESKVTDNHYVSFFQNGNSYAVNVSFIGKSKRNYYWLLADYAEHKIFYDLSSKYGFLFFIVPPVKYVTDPEGYLVSKLVFLQNDLMLNTLSYAKVNLRNVFEWGEGLSKEGDMALFRELCTAILTKTALGYGGRVSEYFDVNPDTRELINGYGYSEVVSEQAYASAPNNLVEPGAALPSPLLGLDEIKQAASALLESKVLPVEVGRRYGFNKPLLLTRDSVKSKEFEANELPEQLFLMEYGIFKEEGEKLLSKKVEPYNDFFSLHVKNSGLPALSSPSVKIMNRFMLFSVVTAMLRGV